MKTLILYGQHIEEKAVCKAVAEEYLERWMPDKELIKVLPLQNSVPTFTPSNATTECYNEIETLIVTYKPKTVINLHHSAGYPWLYMPRKIEVMFLTKGADESLFNYLNKQKDIAQVKYRKPRQEEAFYDLATTASDNSCTLLWTELPLQGSAWKFPDNRKNRASKNKLIDLLNRVSHFHQFN
jgi:hypothetical protein